MTPETKSRKLEVCPGCGQPKQRGIIVCWECFKYCANPFKDAGLSLLDWLETVPASWQAKIARSGLA